MRVALAKGTTGRIAHECRNGAHRHGVSCRALRGTSTHRRGRERGTRTRTREAPLLSDVTLPIYPFYVRVQPRAAHPVTARLSAMSAARLATVMTSGSRPRVDWRETLVTGAPVLRSPQWRLPSSSCPPPCAGSFAQHNAGLVIYSASAGTDYDLASHARARERAPRAADARRRARRDSGERRGARAFRAWWSHAFALPCARRGHAAAVHRRRRAAHARWATPKLVVRDRSAGIRARRRAPLRTRAATRATAPDGPLTL